MYGGAITLGRSSQALEAILVALGTSWRCPGGAAASRRRGWIQGATPADRILENGTLPPTSARGLSDLARLPGAAPLSRGELLIDYLSQAREALGQVCVKELRLLEAARDRIGIIGMVIGRLAKPLSCLRVVFDEHLPYLLQGQLGPYRYRRT